MHNSRWWAFNNSQGSCWLWNNKNDSTKQQDLDFDLKLLNAKYSFVHFTNTSNLQSPLLKVYPIPFQWHLNLMAINCMFCPPSIRVGGSIFENSLSASIRRIIEVSLDASINQWLNFNICTQASGREAPLGTARVLSRFPWPLGPSKHGGIPRGHEKQAP